MRIFTLASVRSRASTAAGIALDGLARHHLDGAPGASAGLVLGFAAPTRRELRDALTVLTAVLRAPAEEGDRGALGRPDARDGTG
ncbi:Transcriptional regulator, GntR family [Blastococcus saxobsidens DD2]|uniref:Transcriptional regulator, GntR family n=1 Tax=Blastococcus saxobsidens (strain DD2) TaxID=1146883 RepID=H6RPI3_BLASD|nr:Transcriptional regulator, GntR family [Blastococcus saxobsidens DD2]